MIEVYELTREVTLDEEDEYGVAPSANCVIVWDGIAFAGTDYHEREVPIVAYHFVPRWENDTPIYYEAAKNWKSIAKPAPVQNPVVVFEGQVIAA